MGIKGEVLEWTRSFLKNRRQRVIVDGEPSTWAPVVSGIPQGSVIGPVLFVCYINDLPETILSPCEMFADDTKVHRVINSPDEQAKLQRDIDRLLEWSDKWLLKFNASKCKVLQIGNQDDTQTYHMNNVTLENVTEERDLGVTVDQNLTFHDHVDQQVAKANQILGLIRRALTYIDGDVMRTLFNSLVCPHLEYSAVVWRPINKEYQYKIENVLRRATRLVPEIRHLDYEDRLKALDMPSMLYRHRRGDAIEAWKCLKWKCPDDMEMF